MPINILIVMENLNLCSIRHLKEDKNLSRNDIVEYLDRMADTIVEFDSVNFDYYYQRGQKSNGVLFKKSFDDGKMQSFEIVSSNKRALNLQTMYMEKGDYTKKKSAKSLLMDNPSANAQDEDWSNFNNSITKPNEKVKIKLSDRDDTYKELFEAPREVVETLSNQIDNWLQGKMKSNEVFALGRTPAVLKELGAKELPIVMAQEVLSKTNGAYVLLGLAENKDNYVVIRSIVNKKTWKLEEYEELYAIKKKSIQKRDVGLKAPALHLKSGYGTSPTISIANFLDFVNSQPLGGSVLSLDVVKSLNSQREFDENVTPHLLYSDREDITVYDLIGERDRLLKEKEKFKADVERLKERLKIERKLTHGNHFNENQLGTVAGHLRKIANSNMDKVELMKALKDVYSFIANTEQLTWEDVFIKSYNLAEKMLNESKPVYEVDEYSKRILNDIRNTKISLSEEQKKEAQTRFGKNWNRHFFNRVGITDSGIPIESKWKEWSEQYGR